MRSLARGDASIYAAIVISILVVVFASLYSVALTNMGRQAEVYRDSLYRYLEAASERISIYPDPASGSIYASSSSRTSIIYIVVRNSSHIIYSGPASIELQPGVSREVLGKPVADLVIRGSAELLVFTSRGNVFRYPGPGGFSNGLGGDDAIEDLLARRAAWYVNSYNYSPYALAFTPWIPAAVSRGYTSMQVVASYIASSPSEWDSMWADRLTGWGLSSSFTYTLIGAMALNQSQTPKLVGILSHLDGPSIREVLYSYIGSGSYDVVIYILTEVQGVYPANSPPWDQVAYYKSAGAGAYPYILVARNLTGVARPGWCYSSSESYAYSFERQCGSGSIIAIVSSALPGSGVEAVSQEWSPVYRSNTDGGSMPSIEGVQALPRGGGGGSAWACTAPGSYESYCWWSSSGNGGPGGSSQGGGSYRARDIVEMALKRAVDVWISYALGKPLASIATIPVWGGSSGGWGGKAVSVAWNGEVYAKAGRAVSPTGGLGGGSGGLAFLYTTYLLGSPSDPVRVRAPGKGGGDGACWATYLGYSWQDGGGGGDGGLAVLVYRYPQQGANAVVESPGGPGGSGVGCKGWAINFNTPEGSKGQAGRAGASLLLKLGP